MTTKQELKQCFERIEPSEALIRETLRRMQEVREGRESAPVRMPSFAFGYRLVGALCALLLVCGLVACTEDEPAEEPQPQETPVEALALVNASQHGGLSPGSSSHEKHG